MRSSLSIVFDCPCEQPGSCKFFHDFFRVVPQCDFMAELTRCCVLFQVDARIGSFLGSGANGRVWQVVPRVPSEASESKISSSASERHIANNLQALKIAVGEANVHIIRCEHDAFSFFRCALFVAINFLAFFGIFYFRKFPW